MSNVNRANQRNNNQNLRGRERGDNQGRRVRPRHDTQPVQYATVQQPEESVLSAEEKEKVASAARILHELGQQQVPALVQQPEARVLLAAPALVQQGKFDDADGSEVQQVQGVQQQDQVYVEQKAQKAQKNAQKKAKRPTHVQHPDDPTQTINISTLCGRRRVQDPDDDDPEKTVTKSALYQRNFRKKQKKRSDASNCDTEINTKKSRQVSQSYTTTPTEQYAQLAQHALARYQELTPVQLVARAPVQGLKELQVPLPKYLSSLGNSYNYKSLAALSNAIDNISSGDALTPKDIILTGGGHHEGYTQFLSNYQEEYQVLNLIEKEKLMKNILGYLINNGFTFRSKKNAYTAEENFEIMTQRAAFKSIKYFFEKGSKTGLKNRH